MEASNQFKAINKIFNAQPGSVWLSPVVGDTRMHTSVKIKDCNIEVIQKVSVLPKFDPAEPITKFVIRYYDFDERDNHIQTVFPDTPLSKFNPTVRKTLRELYDKLILKK